MYVILNRAQEKNIFLLKMQFTVENSRQNFA